MPKNIESTRNGSSSSKTNFGKTSLKDGPGGLESHVYSPKGRVPDSNAVQDDLVSSQGLVMFFFQSCLVTRSDAPSRLLQDKIGECHDTWCVKPSMINQPLEIHLDEEGRVPSWFVASNWAGFRLCCLGDECAAPLHFPINV